MNPPCLLFEDDHLLVLNKPAGLNTHAPAPFAGEGLYDWLRHREPRWAALAIIHRLDKDTSGVLVFSKTQLASQSLTLQFTERSVRKRYILLTDRPVPQPELTARSILVRSGDHYLSQSHGPGLAAETHFKVLPPDPLGRTLLEAIPRTGRTHQIRVHAADLGFPILGDIRYGGTAFKRLCLHAGELTFKHPSTGAEVTFSAVPEFDLDPVLGLREALFDLQLTDAYRLVHGRSDQWPGWYVDRLGPYLLSSAEDESVLAGPRAEALEVWLKRYRLRGVYHKPLLRKPGSQSTARNSPRCVLGDPAPDPLLIIENGIQFTLSFAEGYSVGLFLDQRDNRRRLLTNHIAADFPLFTGPPGGAQVLNAFAYTCGFSVCAARLGAHTTSLDLSRKYLQWGQRNFQLNGLDPAAHNFVFGDAFDWFRRLAKKQRQYDLILLDPPTFSRSKEHGTFQAEKDYQPLVQAALPLLKPSGVLFASTNSASLEPEAFVSSVAAAITACKRTIRQQKFFPQPPDFPVSRLEPAYLKTLWSRLD